MTELYCHSIISDRNILSQHLTKVRYLSISISSQPKGGHFRKLYTGFQRLIFRSIPDGIDLFKQINSSTPTKTVIFSFEIHSTRTSTTFSSLSKNHTRIRRNTPMITLHNRSIETGSLWTDGSKFPRGNTGRKRNKKRLLLVMFFTPSFVQPTPQRSRLDQLHDALVEL